MAKQVTSFANAFMYESAYAYNSMCFAYINCVLQVPAGPIYSGQLVPEIIVNFKTGKMKLNVNGAINTVPFNLSWNDLTVTTKDVDADDSDFDCADEDDMSSASGSSEDGSTSSSNIE